MEQLNLKKKDNIYLTFSKFGVGKKYICIHFLSNLQIFLQTKLIYFFAEMTY